MENQHLQFESNAIFSNPAINFLQDESLSIIANTPILASSCRVSFAKENAYPKQQSFSNSSFNLCNGGDVGVGPNRYVWNPSIRSNAGGDGTLSWCLASCPFHCHTSQ